MSGVTLGVILGFILIDYLEPHDIKLFFAICSIVGGLIGIGVGWFFSRRDGMEEAYTPEFRSADLDAFYRREYSLKHEKMFLKAVQKFDKGELLTSLVMRYYKLSDKCTDRAISLIREQAVSKDEVSKVYNTLYLYSDVFNGGCPCCQNREHIVVENNEVQFCSVCGFDIEFDNPKSVMNRVRWKIGMYSQSKISLKEIQEIIYEE